MSTKGTIPDDAAWRLALGFEPKYQRRIVDYCAATNMSERGLKKWIRLAREKWIERGCPEGGPQFPPLDDPAKIPEWQLAHMPNSPRIARFAAAAASATSGTSAPAASDNAAPAAPPRAAAGPEPLAPVNINDVKSIDYAAAVERQGRYVAVAMQRYDEASARPDTSAATLAILAKERDAAMEKYTRSQQELWKLEEERGDRPHLDDIREELKPIIEHLATSLIEDLCAYVPGMNRDTARQFTDRWARRLQGSRFTSEPTDVAA